MLDQPSIFFEIALNREFLEKYFWELFSAVGFQQNSHHIDDVFIHTMKAIDSCKDLGINDLETRMAILFHDLGKIPARKAKK